MKRSQSILILGASYGSLLAAKFLIAGHTVELVCLREEADLINADGIRVRFPIKGRDDLVEVDSRKLPGKLSANVPKAIDPSPYDLVVLAMQEPQYSSPGVIELLRAVATAQIPCMSIMNMPPLPYLKRLPSVPADACRTSYTEPAAWDSFNPAMMTLCSPDPQAFRPPAERPNVLQVRLPTNFKSARFPSEAHTTLLRRLEADVEAARFDNGGNAIDLPVKLRVHDSVFVPLAKWAMLITGNYRCITNDGIRSIKEAVHTDLALSHSVYDWVVDLCMSLGAEKTDLVPFEKYASAAQALSTPSSAARALYSGALHIERVDRLVQTIAAHKQRRSAVVEEIVALVDARLEANVRAKMRD